MGLTLDEVYRELRISSSHLRALEEGMLHDLPEGECYALGFLKTYAVFLSLDPDPLVDAYRASQARPHARFLSRDILSDPASLPAWMGPVLTWGSVCGIIALGWLAYTVVFQPNADTAKTRASASSFEILQPFEGERVE